MQSRVPLGPGKFHVVVLVLIFLLNKTFFKIFFEDVFALIFFLKCLDGNSFFPRRDFAQRARIRGVTLVTRAYIKESTHS